MLEGYVKESFTAPIASDRKVTHDFYSKGDQSATIVIIQEAPGIGPETLALADRMHKQGFRVVLPHLFGPLGRTSRVGNLARVFCMRREFHLFEKNHSSPVVDWLKALCRHLRLENGARNIGVIGMCLTGNFALTLVAEDSVLAAVASQPSLPIQDKHGLAMSDREIAATREKLDTKGPMLALRFSGDRLCSAARFSAIDKAFNDDRERVRFLEIPGDGHSTLTLDFIRGGEPAREALSEVIAYFRQRLCDAA
ncbi:MAG: dienelactone hydrolase family protein [Gammaproteobacteria bacterium]|nr:dienelactone hydrolase family protein [Pseudomonadales bacterium]MCP5348118.1 dienelactone hydrolase family protein [Pseudomonadales bacterium]